MQKQYNFFCQNIMKEMKIIKFSFQRGFAAMPGRAIHSQEISSSFPMHNFYYIYAIFSLLG